MCRKTIKDIWRSSTIQRHHKEVVQWIPLGTCFTRWRSLPRLPGSSSHWRKCWCCAAHDWKRKPHARPMAIFRNPWALPGARWKRYRTIFRRCKGLHSMGASELDCIGKEGTCRIERENPTKIEARSIELCLRHYNSKRNMNLLLRAW